MSIKKEGITMSRSYRICMILLVLCVVITLLPVQAFAETAIVASGSCGRPAKWVLTEDETLTISGSGLLDSYFYSKAPWVDHYKIIKHVVIEAGVQSIGAYSFGGYPIETLEIPGSVMDIGQCAFYDCDDLQKLILPDGVLNIGRQAFTWCEKIETVTFPQSIRLLDAMAFEYCRNLKTIYFEGNAPEFSGSVFGSVNATVYYPANNETWTEDVMQNYGGTLTWVPYEVEDTSEDITVTINSAIASVTEPDGGWKEGTNTFTVTNEAACIVAVNYDGGSTYMRLTATTANAEDTYSFTADNITADSIIAVAITGDVNKDGSISNADITRMKAVYQGKVSLDSLYQLAADVNGSGDITNADVTRLKAVYQNKTSFAW